MRRALILALPALFSALACTATAEAVRPSAEGAVDARAKMKVLVYAATTKTSENGVTWLEMCGPEPRHAEEMTLERVDGTRWTVTFGRCTFLYENRNGRVTVR